MNFFKSKTPQIISDDDLVIKDNYLEVSHNFKISDLKPFQRLIMINHKNINKKFLIDFALSKNEIDRLKSQNLESRTQEVKTDKPFRLISSRDIELGQGVTSSEKFINPSEELSILENLSEVDKFLKSKTNFVFNKPPSSNKGDKNLDSLDSDQNSFKNKFSKFARNNNEDDKNSEINGDLIEKEIINNNDEISDEFIYIENQDAINKDMKTKYNNKLIYDDSGNIEIFDNEIKRVVLPFKLREVNDEWKKNDPSFFRAPKKGEHKWFTNRIEEDFLKSLEDSYNGNISSIFNETYEPIAGVSPNYLDIEDANSIYEKDQNLPIVNVEKAQDLPAVDLEEENENINKDTVYNEIEENENVNKDTIYNEIEENENVNNENFYQDENELDQIKDEKNYYDIVNKQIEVDFDPGMLTVKNSYNNNANDNESVDKNYHDDTLFFKQEYNSNDIVEPNDSNGTFSKNMYTVPKKTVINSKYEKIRLSRLNNMVIVRKKIDKKLIKERSQKNFAY